MIPFSFLPLRSTTYGIGFVYKDFSGGKDSVKWVNGEDNNEDGEACGSLGDTLVMKRNNEDEDDDNL